MSEALEGLERLARDRAERDGLTAALAATDGRLQQAENRVTQARLALAEEQADVLELESLSMTRILAALRGNREADLDRERAEAAAAEYAVAEAGSRAAVERAEVASLAARIDAFGDLESRKVELLTRREAEVGADPAGAATSARLTELAEIVGSLDAQRVQLDEAHRAGEAAHQALLQAAQHLGSAGSWATYDTFFGGGLVADLVKHDKLDRAAALMRSADATLAHLATELADVGIEAVGDIGITSMTKALDVWFDNIFSDWAVRDRVKQAEERVHRLLGEVSDIGREVVRRQDQARGELTSATAERERLLTGRG